MNNLLNNDNVAELSNCESLLNNAQALLTKTTCIYIYIDMSEIVNNMGFRMIVFSYEIYIFDFNE